MRPCWNSIENAIRDLSHTSTYDAILLFGDSLNYLLTLDLVKKTLSEAVAHLSDHGVFLFDMHTPERYEEFKEEYCEEGLVLDHPFQWTIQSLPDQLINHHFAFYDESGHAQTISFDQRVYALKDITSILDDLPVVYDCYSDFVPGIHLGSEKTLIAVRRS
jgi:hypothetical protein